MEIQVIRRPNVAVLKLSGAFDMGATVPFDERFREIFDSARETQRVIAVDLRRVLYLDSSAVGAIIKALVRVRREGGALLLVDPVPEIRAFFRNTRLDESLRILTRAEFEREFSGD